VPFLGEISLPHKESVSYRAVLLPSARVRAMLFSILALGMVLSALLWIFQAAQPLACTIVTVLLVGLPALLAFSRGIVTVAGGSLRLTAFPVFRKTVSLADVESVKVATADPWNDYRGLGYRLAGNGEIGFLYDRGPAVQVWMRDERVYVVGDPNADRLAQVLRRALADRN